MKNESKSTRRRFLSCSAGAMGGSLVFPSIIPAAALGRGATPPSDRVTVGILGSGGRGVFETGQYPSFDNTVIVALCDAQERRRLSAKDALEKQYAKQRPGNPNRGIRMYRDFRELLAQKDVDAVYIASPDHWHVSMLIPALKAGKHVHCEKPLGVSIEQDLAALKAARKYKKVFQYGAELRAFPEARKGIELVANGRIGKVHAIRTSVPFGASQSPPFVAMPVPEELAYDLWQGPAAVKPYTEQRVHQIHGYERPGWMNIRAYSDSMILNWTTHLNDIAQWGHNTDRTGPVAVEGRGKYPPPGSLWDACYEFEFTCTYADGVQLICKTDARAPHTRFEGEGGWVQANFGGVPLEAEPKSLLDSKIGPNELHIPLMHEKRDFLNAVKTRGATLEDAEVGHRAASLGHLGQIAIQVGRKLKWDPDKEVFIDDDEANNLRSLPPGRSPWAMEPS